MPRANKTTRRQYEIYLNELRTNKPFLENKFDASNPDILKKSWKELSIKLNACGGPQKDTVGWKRVFTDWKSQVRAKARKNRAAYLETGNISTSQKILNDLEKSLLEITGRVVVDGMPIPELGTIEPTITDSSNYLGNSGIEEIENLPLVEPSESSFSKKPEKLLRKRKRTLTDALNTILDKKSIKNGTLELQSVLTEINTSLKKLVKIEKKKLSLKQLKLQVQYPDHQFELSSEEDN